MLNSASSTGHQAKSLSPPPVASDQIADETTAQLPKASCPPSGPSVIGRKVSVLTTPPLADSWQNAEALKQWLQPFVEMPHEELIKVFQTSTSVDITMAMSKLSAMGIDPPMPGALENYQYISESLGTVQKDRTLTEGDQAAIDQLQKDLENIKEKGFPVIATTMLIYRFLLLQTLYNERSEFPNLFQQSMSYLEARMKPGEAKYIPLDTKAEMERAEYRKTAGSFSPGTTVEQLSRDVLPHLVNARGVYKCKLYENFYETFMKEQLKEGKSCWINRAILPLRYFNRTNALPLCAASLMQPRHEVHDAGEINRHLLFSHDFAHFRGFPSSRIRLCIDERSAHAVLQSLIPRQRKTATIDILPTEYDPIEARKAFPGWNDSHHLYEALEQATLNSEVPEYLIKAVDYLLFDPTHETDEAFVAMRDALRSDKDLLGDRSQRLLTDAKKEQYGDLEETQNTLQAEPLEDATGLLAAYSFYLAMGLEPGLASECAIKFYRFDIVPMKSY
ncbi:MAG: hypothetical protein ACR2PT_11310 [Endozoicomonas sp.]